MANSNKTISIGFKIEDGADGLKTLTMDANALRQVMNATVEESKQLQGHLVNFASVATGIDSLSSSFSSLLAFVEDLTGAYDTQKEVETQLEQVMRNTMHAREEDIQSIKDFCSAQQQIGVVGDEVQLAGAQEMATYLEKIEMPMMGDATLPDLDKKGSQEKTRLQEINKLLAKYQEQYASASEAQKNRSGKKWKP